MSGLKNGSTTLERFGYDGEQVMSEEFGEYGFTKEHLMALVKLQVSMEHLLQRIERFELRVENRLTLVEQNIASKHDLEKLERELRAEILQTRTETAKHVETVTRRADVHESDLRGLQKEVWKWSGFAAAIGIVATLAVKILWH